MKSDVKEKINSFNDFEVIRCYEKFSQSLFSNLQAGMPELLKGLPAELEMGDQIKNWQFLPENTISQELKGAEAAVFARTALIEFAENPQTSSVLKDFMKDYKDNEQAALTILALGGVISMIMLVATSKIENTDGKLKFSIGGNRDPKELEALGNMIKNIFGSIPERLLGLIKS